MNLSVSSLDNLNIVKLRLYQAGLTIACIILSILYWQMYQVGPLEAEERFIFPAALMFCSASLIFFMVYQHRFIRLFDIVICALVFLYDWLHYADGLNKARLLEIPIDFTRFLIWLPIIYAVFFLCFSIRRAALASGIFLASLAAPAVYHLWKIQGRETFAEDFSMLINIIASGMVFTVIFLTLATLKERYTEAVSAAHVLKERTEIDYLTQVYSRAKIFETLEQRLATSRIDQQPFSIMVIDLDNFKSVNDKYGHAAGDQALKQAALTIRSASRRSDLVGRIGGDEFLIVCQETGAEEINKLETRLHKAMQELQTVPEALSISCGSATLQPNDTVELLFRRADQAMYHSKSQKKTSSQSMP